MRFRVSIQRLTPTIIEQSVPMIVEPNVPTALEPSVQTAIEPSVPTVPSPDDTVGVSQERVPTEFVAPVMPVVPLRDPQRDLETPLVRTVQVRTTLPIDEEHSPIGIVYRREAVLPPFSAEQVVELPPAVVRFDMPTEIDWFDLGAFEIPENWPNYARSIARTILLGGSGPIETTSGYRIEPVEPTRSLAQVYDSILSVRPLGDSEDANLLGDLNNKLTELLSGWSSQPIDPYAPAGDTSWVASALAQLESVLNQSDTVTQSTDRYWNALQTYLNVLGHLEPYLVDHLLRVWSHRYGVPTERIRQTVRHVHLLGPATGYAASLTGPYESHSIRNLASIFAHNLKWIQEGADLFELYKQTLELLLRQEYGNSGEDSREKPDTSAIDKLNEHLIRQAQARPQKVARFHEQESLNVEDLAMARLIYENLDEEDRKEFARDFETLVSDGGGENRLGIIRKYLFETGFDAATPGTGLSEERERAQKRTAQWILDSPAAMAGLIRSVLFHRYMERQHPQLRRLMRQVNAIILGATDTETEAETETGTEDTLDKGKLQEVIEKLSEYILRHPFSDAELEAVDEQDQDAEVVEDARGQIGDALRRLSLSKQTILRNYVMDMAHLTGQIMASFLFAIRYVQQVVDAMARQRLPVSSALGNYQKALKSQALRRLGLVRLVVARMVATAGVAYVEQKVRNWFAVPKALEEALKSLKINQEEVEGLQLEWNQSGHHVWATQLKRLEFSYLLRIGLLKRSHTYDVTSVVDYYLGRAVDAIAATAQQIMHWVENTPIQADLQQFADIWVARYQNRLGVVDEITEALREALDNPNEFANRVVDYLTRGDGERTTDHIKSNALRALAFGTVQPTGSADRADLIRARVGLVLTRAFMQSGLYNGFSKTGVGGGSSDIADELAGLFSEEEIAPLIDSDPLVHQLARDASLVGAFAPAAILTGRAIAKAMGVSVEETDGVFFESLMEEDAYGTLIAAIWPEAGGGGIGNIANMLKDHASVWIDVLQTGLSWSLVRAAYGLGLAHWNALASERIRTGTSDKWSRPIMKALTIASKDAALKGSLKDLLVKISQLAKKRGLPLLYQERYVRQLSESAPYDDLERVLLGDDQGGGQEGGAVRFFRAKSVQDRLEELVSSNEILALLSPELFGRPFERNADHYDAYSLANLFRLFANHFAYSMHAHAHLLHRFAEQMTEVLVPAPDFGTVGFEGGAGRRLALAAAVLTLGTATSLATLMRRVSDEIAQRYARQLMDGAVSFRFRFVPWWSDQLHNPHRGAATTQTLAKSRIASYIDKVQDAGQTVDTALITNRFVQSVNEQGFLAPVAESGQSESGKSVSYVRGTAVYAQNTPVFMQWYLQLDSAGKITSGQVERRNIAGLGNEVPLIRLEDQSLHTDYRVTAAKEGDQAGGKRAGVGTLIQAAIHYQTLRDALWLSVLDGLESATRRLIALANHLLNEPGRYEETIVRAFRLEEDHQKFGTIDPNAVIELMFPTPTRAVDLTGLRATGREGNLLVGKNTLRLYSTPVEATEYRTIDLLGDIEEMGGATRPEAPLQGAFMVAVGVHHRGQPGSQGRKAFEEIVQEIYNDQTVAVEVSEAIERWKNEAIAGGKDLLDEVSVSDRHRWRGMLATMAYLHQLPKNAPQRKGRVVLLTDPNRVDRAMPWIVPPRLTIQTEVEVRKEEEFVITRKVSVQVPVAYVIYYEEKEGGAPYIDVIYHRYPIRQFSESGQLDSYSVEFKVSDWEDHQKLQFYRSLLELGRDTDSFRLSSFPVFSGLYGSGRSVEEIPPAIADQTYLFEMVQRAHDLLSTLFENEFPSSARDRGGLRIPLDFAYQTFYVTRMPYDSLVEFLMQKANTDAPASKKAIANNVYKQRDVLDRLLTFASIGYAPNAYTEYVRERETFGLFGTLRPDGAPIVQLDQEPLGESQTVSGEQDEKSQDGSGKRTLTIREGDINVAGAVATFGALEKHRFEPKVRLHKLVYYVNPGKNYATRIGLDTVFEPQVVEQPPESLVRHRAVRRAQLGLVSGLPGEFASSTALLNVHQNAHILTVMLLTGMFNAKPEERAGLIQGYGELIDEYHRRQLKDYGTTLMQIADDYLRWSEKNGFDWRVALSEDNEKFVELFKQALPDVANQFIEQVRRSRAGSGGSVLESIRESHGYEALKKAIRDALVDQMIYRGITDAFYSFVQHIVPSVGHFTRRDILSASPNDHPTIRRLFGDITPDDFVGYARLIAEVGMEMAQDAYTSRINAISVRPTALAEQMQFVYQALEGTEPITQEQATQTTTQTESRTETRVQLANLSFLQEGPKIIIALWRKFRMGDSVSQGLLERLLQTIKSLMPEERYKHLIRSSSHLDSIRIGKSWERLLKLWDRDARADDKEIGLEDLYLTAFSLKEALQPSDPRSEEIVKAIPPKPGLDGGLGYNAWISIGGEEIAGEEEGSLIDRLKEYEQLIQTERPAEGAEDVADPKEILAARYALVYLIANPNGIPSAETQQSTAKQDTNATDTSDVPSAVDRRSATERTDNATDTPSGPPGNVRSENESAKRRPRLVDPDGGAEVADSDHQTTAETTTQSDDQGKKDQVVKLLKEKVDKQPKGYDMTVRQKAAETLGVDAQNLQVNVSVEKHSYVWNDEVLQKKAYVIRFDAKNDPDRFVEYWLIITDDQSDLGDDGAVNMLMQSIISPEDNGAEVPIKDGGKTSENQANVDVAYYTTRARVILRIVKPKDLREGSQGSA